MKSKDLIKKMSCLLVPYIKKMMIVFLCLIISSIVSFFIPVINQKIIDYGFVEKKMSHILSFSTLLFILYMMNEIFNFIKYKKRAEIASDLHCRLLEDAMKHILKLKTSHIDALNKSELINNMNIDIDNILLITEEGVLFAVTQIFNVLGGALGLYFINSKLLLIVLLFIPLKIGFILFLSKKRELNSRNFMSNFETFIHDFTDIILGIRVIRNFGIQNIIKNEFNNASKAMAESKQKLEFSEHINLITDNVLVQLLNFLLYVFGAYLVVLTNLSIGSVIAFVSYSIYITSPITAILNTRYIFAGILPSVYRYFEFMNLEEEADGKENISDCIESIRLKNVCFSYDNTMILNNLSLDINSKEKIAIIGKNGSGKTTLINLLLRFIVPSSGNISVNGKNIQFYKLDEYRECFSVVSQDVFLFNKSIRENITLQRQIDDEKIFWAIKESGLEDFVQQVSLDYVVGSNGCLLSGGQKQKIALARALVFDRPIVIFDEATSNIDSISVSLMNNLVQHTLKDKIVLCITHTPQLLSTFDRIVEIKNQQLEEV